MMELPTWLRKKARDDASRENKRLGSTLRAFSECLECPALLSTAWVCFWQVAVHVHREAIAKLGIFAGAIGWQLGDNRRSWQRSWTNIAAKYCKPHVWRQILLIFDMLKSLWRASVLLISQNNKPKNPKSWKPKVKNSAYVLLPLVASV